MKTVIYKDLTGYKTTTEQNFNARIQNARLIHNMQNFASAQEIIEYFCKWFNCTEQDFIIDQSCEGRI